MADKAASTSSVPTTAAHLAFWRILGLGVLMYVVPGVLVTLAAIWQVDAVGQLAVHIATSHDAVTAASGR